MKNNFGISKLSTEIILETIAQFEEIERVVIFGSRAMGHFKKGSDVDLAIYGASLGEDTSLNLAASLNEKAPTPYYFDIVAPAFLSNQNLIQHIDRVGKEFYSRKNPHPTPRMREKKALLR